MICYIIRVASLQYNDCIIYSIMKIDSMNATLDLVGPQEGPGPYSLHPSMCALVVTVLD